MGKTHKRGLRERIKERGGSSVGGGGGESAPYVRACEKRKALVVEGGGRGGASVWAKERSTITSGESFSL